MTCVEFAHQNILVVESAGSVDITVQFSGKLQLETFHVTIIAYEDRSSSATGYSVTICLSICIHMYQCNVYIRIVGIC